MARERERERETAKGLGAQAFNGSSLSPLKNDAIEVPTYRVLHYVQNLQLDTGVI